VRRLFRTPLPSLTLAGGASSPNERKSLSVAFPLFLSILELLFTS
jgi:hypothetical protein